MEGSLITQVVGLGIFATFIHAIVEVVKGISAKGIFKIISELFGTLLGLKHKDGTPVVLTEETIHTLVFVLALTYCKTFGFAAMSGILHVEIAATNAFAWWADFIGTASIVYVGVDVWYSWILKMKGSITGQTNGGTDGKTS